MLQLARQIAAASEVITRTWSYRPRVGIILGTGLGNFVEQINDDLTISYSEIPHFPRSTAIGHKGLLVCGRLGSVPVVAMQGRCHLYEGYSARLAMLPVRVMREMGTEVLIVSNASGGLNPAYALGDVMVIDDHINLMGQNPLMGRNDRRLGPRFPDMCRPYDRDLIDEALATASAHNFACHRGVYAAMLGPNYETRAEYRFLRQMGADVVGMSTVPEVIVAVHAGLRALGLSAVANLCYADRLHPPDAYQVTAAAESAEPKIGQIVKSIVANLETV